ncbi:MAG: hypothetical protein EXS64_09720 [Candidatus Latescibacteria bacterium]|nr:hypothetical protein [Candidatus Latescibacterota bacterium]
MSPLYGFPEGTMFTALCMKCSKRCKQPATVTLVHCPIFEPRLNFDELMDQLDRFEQDATELKARTVQLLTEAAQVAQNGPAEEEEEASAS